MSTNSPNTLVSVSELAAHPQWVVIDCRHDLGNPDHAGAAAFAAGHIPGARFLSIETDLSGIKTGRNGRHPLPDPEHFAARMAAIGVETNSTVVFYDADAGMFAARGWWMMRWLGLQNVAVLDGGFAAWKAAGQPVSTDDPSFAGGGFVPAVQHRLIVEMNEILASIGKRDAAMIIDARAPDRYAGQNETLDPVGGHIPGAHNRFFRQNLGADGRFKSADVLRQEFLALIGERAPEGIIQQCGSGVTACHNLLAMEIAGLHGSRLYPGSWSEWCADPARPVARGDTP